MYVDVTSSHVYNVTPGSAFAPAGATRVSVLDGRTRTLIEDFLAENPFGPGGIFVA